MIDVINDIKSKVPAMSALQNLNLRAGIHTGPVIAGIIGAKTARYDIFGSGVMITERIQQEGQPGRVYISSDTHRILLEESDIASQFNFEEYKSINIVS